ncbi:MAG: hypothetical protein sL5_07210 [Candidatus Mesenet longicola]|uniref:Uncharacterized protein n=1 Tax=Candidatus Mesenet longicola TaxID=1892558 RepID=A0A8J3HQG1_9RICK|nr:MAG: hypothetical protein sGL2_07930 [Candidatus Mesenet longicola]GHM59728.1 MAG: hypothetical protein sL5_07210 [Candidatus Mesenet longicola]
MLEANSLGSKQEQLGKEQLETLKYWKRRAQENIKSEQNDEIENIKEEARKTKSDVKLVLNKHLVDNVIIHSDDKFIETSGPKTASAKTVTYNDNTNNDSHFVIKYESLKNTITEVIAGSLYKALLYNRSPNFTLVEESDGSNKLKLKSKLLNNFVTLDEFVSNVRQERFMDLIYEKFANEDGKKELIKHSTYYFYNVEQFKKSIEYFKEKIKKQEEFFDIIIKQLGGIEKNTLLKDLPIFGDILIQMFEKFKDRKELIGKLFYSPEITFSVKYKYDMLLSKLNKLYNEQNETLVKMMGPIIKTMVKSETSFKNITKRLDEKELNKELITEIIEEIQNRKYIEKQLVDYVSQTVNREVQGIEKLITAMLLLGYKDISDTNMGIMKLIYENKHDDTITENVYAKVDMSDSFHNLQYKDHS